MPAPREFHAELTPPHNRDAALVLPAGRMTLFELRAWTLLMIGVAYWANIVRTNDAGQGLSLIAIANSVITEGAFNVLAWIVVFENARSSPREARASGRQICQAVLLCAISVAPTKQAAAIAMLGFAALFCRQPEIATRRVAIIMLALASEIIWTSPYLDFLHVGVGRLDAAVVAALYRAFGYAVGAHGDVIENAGEQFNIIVIAQCSSSYLLASISVAFIVTILFLRRDRRRPGLGWLCAAYFASVVLTELRLVLMAASHSGYEWWHNGPGYPILSLAPTVPVIYCALMASRSRRADVT